MAAELESYPHTLPRMRIVVVDDNPDTAHSLALLLRLLGHEVEVAYSGPEAMDAAERSVPDAVLMDIGLPGFDGLELARRLRGRPTTARALLIAITAFNGDDLTDRARQAGIDYIFTKPAQPESVLRLLGPAREPPDRTSQNSANGDPN